MVMVMAALVKLLQLLLQWLQWLQHPRCDHDYNADYDDDGSIDSIDNIVQENRQSIISNYPKIMRRVSGYNLDDFLDSSNINLTKMVVGSEGTLCVVTEAEIKLVAKPKLTGLAIVHFTDVAQACDATPEILEHQPSAIELIGKMILERTMESVGFSRNLNFIDGRPGSILLVEFSAESTSE